MHTLSAQAYRRDLTYPSLKEVERSPHKGVECEPITRPSEQTHSPGKMGGGKTRKPAADRQGDFITDGIGQDRTRKGTDAPRLN